MSGLPGTSVTADQIATAVSEYMRLNPVQALIGPRGEPGDKQQTILNQETCELLSKYTSEETWFVLAILPKPCI